MVFKFIYNKNLNSIKHFASTNSWLKIFFHDHSNLFHLLISAKPWFVLYQMVGHSCKTGLLHTFAKLQKGIFRAKRRFCQLFVATQPICCFCTVLRMCIVGNLLFGTCRKTISEHRKECFLCYYIEKHLKSQFYY